VTMTINSETRTRSHRNKISRALSLVNRLVRWEHFTNDCELVARVSVQTDHELARILHDCSEYWEFDQFEMCVSAGIGGDVRCEIDVNGLDPVDVWDLLAENRKDIPF